MKDINGNHVIVAMFKCQLHPFFSHLNVNALLPEPEASSEESPSADEEQAASSAAAAEVEEGDGAGGETAPAENGEKADEGAEEPKEDKGAEKKEWVSPESECATLNTAIFHFDSTFICLYDPYLCWITADCSL